MDGGTGVVLTLILTKTIQLQQHVQMLILMDTMQLQGQCHHTMANGEDQEEEGTRAYRKSKYNI